MIHRNVALVTPRSRNTVTTLRQASMKSLLVPFLLLADASGSWLNVKKTWAPNAFTASAHPVMSEYSVLPGWASAMLRQGTTVPFRRLAFTDSISAWPELLSQFV